MGYSKPRNPEPDQNLFGNDGSGTLYTLKTDLLLSAQAVVSTYVNALCVFQVFREIFLMCMSKTQMI